MRAIKGRRGTYFQNIKKIRGGKRHLQRLRAESTWAAPLSTDTLLSRLYYDEKLGLHPWHWHHRKPPRLVRQLAAYHLLTTFFAWQPVLASLMEPVYCAVWLVEPEFAHSSEVTVGIRHSIERHHRIVGDPDPDGPPLPAEYHQIPGADKLTWHTHPWEILVDSFDCPNGWPAWALRKPHYLCQPPEGDEYLLVQTGWMWVGQMPTETV
jgi:hypothetical protein